MEQLSGITEIQSALQGLWIGTIAFLPKLIIAIIIFIVGWLIGALVEKGVARLIESIKLDNLLRQAGFEATLQSAGFKLNSGAFLGGLVKWFFVIVFLVAALDVVGLSQVNIFLSGVVLVYLPKVIVASLILLVASILAHAVAKGVEGGAKAMHVVSARFLGMIAKWAIWVFAIIFALAELGIAAQFLAILFTGIVAMLALAGGLAFGLGGKEHATHLLNCLHKGSCKENCDKC
ncbi:MAG: hypothetical protein K9M36_02830 [Candidatus Pacebacteria bacterium]|nr:hypothetical protein [Candidatus Paceibacterota bacterium]